MAKNAFKAMPAEFQIVTVVQRYTNSVLIPQLRSLGLNRRQREIVVEDVTHRLESLLFHWSDVSFRRTVLVLGTEEASFWSPQSSSLEIRALVVVAVRNSLIEDLGTDQPYTKVLRSPRILLPNSHMPWITSEAILAFQGADLTAGPIEPSRDVFGDLPRRFPCAWHVLSLLGNSSASELEFQLPDAQSDPAEFAVVRRSVVQKNVVVSGIDPRLDDHLLEFLGAIQRGESDLFFSPSFKHITRNPEKLLSILDLVLCHGGAVLTPNYVLSPSYLARRTPLLRPIHLTSDLWSQVANPVGLSERHKQALDSLRP